MGSFQIHPLASIIPSKSSGAEMPGAQIFAALPHTFICQLQMNERQAIHVLEKAGIVFETAVNLLLRED